MEALQQKNTYIISDVLHSAISQDDIIVWVELLLNKMSN